MKKLPYLYSTLIVVVVWYLVHLSDLKFIPSPLETLAFIISEWDQLIIHISISLYRFLLAIAITIICGGLLGVILGRSQNMDTFLSPIIYKLYPIPKIAFLPILILLLGIGNGSKIALIVLILFFQTVLSIRGAVKNIPELYFTSMQTLSPTEAQVYKHVVLPAILPAILTVLRLSVGTGLSILFFSENYATRYGIGYYIMDSWLKLDYVGMFSGIVIISLMGSILFGLIDLLENKLCPWNLEQGR